MPEERTIEERLRTVERALGNGADYDPGGEGEDESRTLSESELEDRLAHIEDQLDELEAGLQAIRGYVSNLDHVNESVERRANAAIAAVERMDRPPRVPPALARIQRPEQPAQPAADDRGGEMGDEPETEPTEGIRAKIQSLV